MAGLTGPDIHYLVESDAPLRWWHGVGKGSGGGSGSFIYPTTLQTIKSATIVVDVNRAEDATLKAVATYAAFVGLAGVRGKADPQSGSILNLFEKPAGKGELSASHREYLTALYTISHERKARYQRGKLVRPSSRGTKRLRERLVRA